MMWLSAIVGHTIGNDYSQFLRKRAFFILSFQLFHPFVKMSVFWFDCVLDAIKYFSLCSIFAWGADCCACGGKDTDGQCDGVLH